MKVTISGKAGSGKSTVASLLAKRLNLQHYSIGDLMRIMAAEKGLSLLDFNKLAEQGPSIDLELDSKLKGLGQTKDNFVVDGRLTAFFIPNAEVRVFLDADDKIRAQRILRDKRQHEQSGSVEEALSSIKKREESEKKRYKKYYGVDYFDKNLYNFVVDTTNLNPDGVVTQILSFIKNKIQQNL